MSYTKFIKCDFTDSDIISSLLIGTNFYENDMHNVNFENCILWYADFEKSNLIPVHLNIIQQLTILMEM